jgi:hypothetical protein
MTARPPKITKRFIVMIWLCVSKAKSFFYSDGGFGFKKFVSLAQGKKERRSKTQLQIFADRCWNRKPTSDKGKPGENRGRKAMDLPSRK